MRRALLVALVTVVGALAAPSAYASTYLVVYRAQAVPADAATTITEAGGTLVASYPEIGVAVARSSSGTFSRTLSADSRVEGAAATDGFASRLAPEDTTPAEALDAPATDSDNLSGLQWDMRQIRTPEAHAITGGSPSVLVGDIDTGLDYTHPDLAPNVDFANSVSCVGGVPNTDPAAWDDDNGHGTHTAGTIAAASNGIGIVGVAPNVRIAGIKAGNADGYFFPEAVICSFMWAATHGIDVTNNSYFADPWLFNCRNDAGQRAIWNAERRAIRFAQSKGVVVVASEGNENVDLSKRNIDAISPDNGTPLTREVTNACAVVPVEVPGVIGVTADGNNEQKSYYSSYGVGTADLVAPGGDRRFQLTAAAPNGRVLSTYPAKFYVPSPLIIKDPSGAVYAYLQGTSMAGPHVAGVAALVLSRYGPLSPGAVAARMQATAQPMPCPANPFDPGGTGAFLATCEGGDGYNGFYGHGEVDALAAVGG